MTNEQIKAQFLKNFISQLGYYVKYHGGSVCQNKGCFATFELNHQKFHVLKHYKNSIRIYFIKGNFIEKIVKLKHNNRNIPEMLGYLMNLTLEREKYQLLNGEAQF